MSCSVFNFQIPQAFPSLCRPRRTSSPPITSCLSQSHDAKPDKVVWPITTIQNNLKKLGSATQYGAVLATIELPAFAVTGENNVEWDLKWIIIQSAITAFFYFILMPPIIMNWLRIRWYRRNLLEMYFQFMFVFLFFPGVLLWAPFLNFRKFPRDSNMKNPWDTPENPDELKNDYLKYPYAEVEDYNNY